MRAMKPTSNRGSVCSTRRRTRARRDRHTTGRTPRLGRHAPRWYATRGDTRSTRRGTDTRSGDRLPDQRHVRDRAIRNYRRRCCSDALESCPGGDDRKRAPWHCVRHGGCAERHRRDRVNLRPTEAHRQSRSVTLLNIRHADHRVSAQPCRAQAPSMPAGPAAGGGGAQRRAWTATSTARDSRTRWSAARTSRTCWCTWAAPFSCTNTRPQTATRDTANHGVNDPRRVAWGHPSGTAWGSFTPWLAYRRGTVVSFTGGTQRRPTDRPDRRNPRAASGIPALTGHGAHLRRRGLAADARRRRGANLPRFTLVPPSRPRPMADQTRALQILVRQVLILQPAVAPVHGIAQIGRRRRPEGLHPLALPGPVEGAHPRHATLPERLGEVGVLRRRQVSSRLLALGEIPRQPGREVRLDGTRALVEEGGPVHGLGGREAARHEQSERPLRTGHERLRMVEQELPKLPRQGVRDEVEEDVSAEAVLLDADGQLVRKEPPDGVPARAVGEPADTSLSGAGCRRPCRSSGPCRARCPASSTGRRRARHRAPSGVRSGGPAWPACDGGCPVRRWLRTAA